jgi:hypothetical protein
VVSATRHLSPVADRDDQHDQYLVADLVDHTEIARSNGPFPGPTHHLLCTGRPRVGCQKFHCGLHVPPRYRIKFAQLSDCGGRVFYLVVHASPRSAVTWSHGMAPSPDSAISSRARCAVLISARSSAGSISRSRSPASIIAATRWPRRVSKTSTRLSHRHLSHAFRAHLRQKCTKGTKRLTVGHIWALDSGAGVPLTHTNRLLTTDGHRPPPYEAGPNAPCPPPRRNPSRHGR